MSPRRCEIFSAMRGSTASSTSAAGEPSGALRRERRIMDGRLLMRTSFALVPVLLFLAVLVRADSYKLLPLRTVLSIAAAGALAAGASYVANVLAFTHFAGDFAAYSRYVSPWIEESLKAVVLVFLIRGRR